MKSARDLLRPKAPIVIGGSGYGSIKDVSMLAALNLLGVKGPTCVAGYGGAGPIRLAYERAEVKFTQETAIGISRSVLPWSRGGKRVGVSRFGAGADRATRLLLSRFGLNPEKDLTLMQIGGTPTRLAALVGNTIDATIIDPPDHKKALEAGMRVLANMEEMGIPFQHPGLVTSRAQMAKSPDVSRRVLKSFVEGIHLAIINPAIVKQAFRRYLRMQHERELDDACQVLRSFIQRKPYLSLEGFKAVFAELAEQIPAAKSADPKDFVDTRFLEEFDRSGYIDGLYR